MIYESTSTKVHMQSPVCVCVRVREILFVWNLSCVFLLLMGFFLMLAMIYESTSIKVLPFFNMSFLFHSTSHFSQNMLSAGSVQQGFWVTSSLKLEICPFTYTRFVSLACWMWTRLNALLNMISTWIINANMILFNISF